MWNQNVYCEIKYVIKLDKSEKMENSEIFSMAANIIIIIDSSFSSNEEIRYRNKFCVKLKLINTCRGGGGGGGGRVPAPMTE